MVLFSEMYFSELLGDPVVDRLEQPIGRVEDAIVLLGEQFPKVLGLVVRTISGDERVLLIGEIDLIGAQFVSTQSVRDRLVLSTIRPGDILIKKNILDQQVVDTSGARVLRVNDLKLAKVGPDVRLIAADVGMRGMLRRLGIERIFDFLFGIFRKKVPDKLIGWNYVELLEADLAKGQIKIPTSALMSSTLPTSLILSVRFTAMNGRRFSLRSVKSRLQKRFMSLSQRSAPCFF